MSTSWPLVWTKEPKKYNWSGEIGRSLDFEVHAIPDPDFPSRWKAQYSGNNSDGTPRPVPPLPDKPTSISYQIISTNIESDEYLKIDNNGLNIKVDNVNVFMPFESIKYMKDDREKSARYPEELKNDGYDYVFEYIPSSKDREIKNITIKATSTSNNDLDGTFYFEIINDYDSARKDLKDLSDDSSKFLGGLVEGNGEVPDSIGSFFDNVSTEVKLPIKKKYKELSNRAEAFGAKTKEESIDSLIKDNKFDSAKEIIGKGEGLAHQAPKEIEESKTSIDKEIKNGKVSKDFLDKIKKDNK